MNYTELQAAILADTHKSQYAGTEVQRFIVQAEALIDANLESYNLLSQLTDSNRVSAGSSNYTLPARLTHLRYVRIAGLPLDKVDETTAYIYQQAAQSTMYAQRIGQINIAGTPGTGVTIDIDYMGMPAPLATTPTNTLLDQAPQLYIEAASVYVFKRAQDYDGAQISLESVRDMCLQLNRKSKKLLGGAQAAPVYPVRFRSAY